MRPLPTLLALLACPCALAAAQAVHWEQTGYGLAKVDLSVDVDGDGLPDAIIGDPQAGAGGVVTVRSGLTGALIHTIQGQPGDQYGGSVVGLGDLNGDGHAEFGIGGYLLELMVRDGLTGALLGFTVDAGITERFAPIGDVNGDGIDDIVVGHPSLGGGVVKVLSGRYFLDGTLPLKLWSVNSSQIVNGNFGEAVITVADLTGDGIDEVIVGAPGEKGVSGSATYFGQLHCLSGADGASIWVRKNLAPSSTWFAGSLANIGDFNGDGMDDIAVGELWNNEQGYDAGAVFIMRSNNSFQLAEYIHSVPDELLGSEVSRVGDVDQDGTLDILVGARGAANGQGMARILSGATMDVIWSSVGTGFLGHVGTLSGGVDATGDGRPDFLTASQGASQGTGHVRLWRTECVGGNTSYCSGGVNSTGKKAILDAVGDVSIAANTLVLEARKCPSQVLGVFFYGTTANSLPFGDGTLCIGGTITRILPAVATDGQGFASLALDLSAAPLGSGPNAVAPGDTRYFQYWYRDPAMIGGTGFNLTDGREITFCP